MKRFLALAVVCLAALRVEAQTEKTRANLYTEIDTSLASATQITATTLRGVMKNVVASAQNIQTDGTAVSTTGTYANPAWLSSLHWSKITNVPTSIAGLGVLNGAALDTIAANGGAYYLARTNHTGEQAISTVTGLQAALDAKQSLDSDLTAIAGLSTTAFGRGLLAETNAASARTTLELGSLATQSGTFSGTSSGTNTGDQNLFGSVVVSGQTTVTATSNPTALTFVAGSGMTITTDNTAKSVTFAASGGGGGTVTSFSAGNLSPLFTTSVATATTTPALSFSLSTQIANRVLAGPSSGADAAPTFRALVADDIPSLTLAKISDEGALASLSTVGTSQIDNGAVTYAKMQDVSATNRFLGRITAGAGDPEELTAANAKTILALTSSDVGLGSVTNDAQTRSAIVPNTVPSAGQILVGNAGGTAYAPQTVGTDATLSSAGALTLATVNSNVGTFGSATAVPQVTVNGKGLVTAVSNVTITDPHALTFVVNGNGSAITTGTKYGTLIKTPYAGTLVGWTMNCYPSGAVTVDVLRSADGAGIPSTSIVGGTGTKPNVSAAIENDSTSFTNWTSTAVTALDQFCVNVTAADGTVQVMSLVLYFR